MIFLGKEIGPGKYPCIVAEISCNHSGYLEQAKELIYQAKWAGADAVKIQVYDADDVTLNTPTEDFIIKDGPWKGIHLYSLYIETQTPYEWVPELFDFAKAIDIPIFASVFSEKGLELLESLGCPAYKIASFEANDLHLISRVAETDKPIIISTGMLDGRELHNVNETVYRWSNISPILLHCVSSYPTKVEECNLSRIKILNSYSGRFIGFSDHTAGIEAGPLACVMGAVMIEKHLILADMMNTEDSSFSLIPNEFKHYVEHCRRAAEATWRTEVPGEQASRQFRRSLYVVKDILQGDKFTMDNVRSIRPSYGLPPYMLDSIIGRESSCDLKAGTAMKQEYIK